MKINKVIINDRLKSYFLWILLIPIVIYSIFIIGKIVCCFVLQDFSAYYQGINLMENGQNPYNNPYGLRFIYPPAALILLSPIGSFTNEQAERVWTTVSFLCLLATIIIILKSVNKEISWTQFLVIYSFAMLAFPVKFTLGMGQINLLILFLISLSFYLYRLRKNYLSGVVLALAASLKLTPLILILFFIQKRQWKTLISFSITLISLSLLAVMVLGVETTKYYWSNVFPEIPTTGNAAYYNQAMTGFLARIQLNDQIARIVNTIVLMGLLAISLRLTKNDRKNPLRDLAEFGLYILAVLIGGGLAWQHHLAVAFVPFVALGLIVHCMRYQKVIFSVAALLAYLLVAFNIKNPQAVSSVSSLLLSHGLAGLLLLFGVLVFILSKKKFNNL